MKTFNNKIVVITGAASGMGRAYALAFAREGSRLALCDYDAEGLAETRRLVADISQQSHCHTVFDVSDRDAMYAFANQVKGDLGDAHVVINNAGVEGEGKPVWALDEAQTRRVMDINFYGVMHGSRAFLPQLLANKEAALVNVSSIFGLVGTPNHADYCAAKFAVRGFTEALMAELSDSPVQVHLVHPGGIDTNISRLAHTNAFASHYLSTPPEAIARQLLKALRRNQPRLVYGNGSTKTWLGARLLPIKLLSRIIWTEMKNVIDRSDYNVIAAKK